MLPYSIADRDMMLIRVVYHVLPSSIADNEMMMRVVSRAPLQYC